jgi:hypothetical protein
MFAQRELGVSSTPHKIKGGGVGMAAINNHLTESNYPFCENSCKPYRTIHILSQKYSEMKIIFFPPPQYNYFVGLDGSGNPFGRGYGSAESNKLGDRVNSKIERLTEM